MRSEPLIMTAPPWGFVLMHVIDIEGRYIFDVRGRGNARIITSRLDGPTNIGTRGQEDYALDHLRTVYIDSFGDVLLYERAGDDDEADSLPRITRL